MSLYPNDKPFEHVEDLISSLFLRDGCEPGTVSWACQTRQHHILEEIIRIQLVRPHIPADLNVASDALVGRILGLGRGFVSVDSTYLFPMRALSSGDPLIMDLCYIIRSNPMMNTIDQFEALLAKSPVRAAYKSLLLADIGLPIKSINQYCTLVWLRQVLDNEDEDISMWFVPKQRDMVAYTTAMAFQPGQIELLCDALVNNFIDSAIQQRQFDIILKLLESLVQKFTKIDYYHQLASKAIPNTTPLPQVERIFLNRIPGEDDREIVGGNAMSHPESHSTLTTLSGQHDTTTTRQSDDTVIATTTTTTTTTTDKDGKKNTKISFLDAFIKLLKSHVVDIADDQWSSNDEQELLFLTQVREKAIQQRHAELRASLLQHSKPLSSSLTQSSSSPVSSNTTLTGPNQLQPNALTNIAVLYKVLSEMHFFSSFYIYSTRSDHFTNISTTLIPIFPQYLWPTSDRCIIKLLSMALDDDDTSGYIGDIDEKIFQIPQKKSDVLDVEDPEVKFGLLIEDEEFLFQRALDIESRRGLWRLAILYACNLNDLDLITSLITLSKVTKLDQFMPESVIQVNGTILAQICNLPHCSATTLHKLLNLYTVKITTNSQSLGIRSNILFKIATKEHIVIINQHPILQQLFGLENCKITDFSHFESMLALYNDSEKKSLSSSLSSSASNLNSSSSGATVGSSSSNLNTSSNNTTNNTTSTDNKKQPSKLNHQALHQEAVLQCLYSLLAYVSRLKIYRPAIVYSDLVVLIQVHASQGLFMPHLYDFLISTVMSDMAISTLFRRNNIINIINSIYSTPKSITHQSKVMTDDYYRFVNQDGLLDKQYNLDEFLLVTGHRKKTTKKGQNANGLDSSTSLNESELGSSSTFGGSGSNNELQESSLNTSSSNTNENKKSATKSTKDNKDGSPKTPGGEEIKLAVKNSFKSINSDIFNTSLPLFNVYFNFVFNRFATVQLFVNSKTIFFESMIGITTYPTSEITSPLDNAVLYHDVPTVDYLLSLGFVPLSSTMYHLHQHFVFDHRNATNSGLFSVAGIQPITLGQTNQLAHYKKLYHAIGSQNQSTPTQQQQFAQPHQFFTPTASFHFDLNSYQEFVGSPIGFNSFRQKIFLHLKAQRLQSGQPAPALPIQLSNQAQYLQQQQQLMSPNARLTPREIYQYYAFASPATELMKLLLQSNCPVFQFKLLSNDHQRLYQQALQKLADLETERREKIDAGDKNAETAKEQLSMYNLLEEQYPGFDSTLVTARLETLFSVDFHAVQFHQLYHQQEMIEDSPKSHQQQMGVIKTGSAKKSELISHIPKITQEDIIALLLSAQHNGNPLLIYHIVQTTQLYMSIYTASFINSSSSSAKSKSSRQLATPILPPYPSIHDALPQYNYDTLTPEGLLDLQRGMSVEEIAKNGSYKKLAATLNAILPLLSESPRPLQLTRSWAVMCGRYMFNLQRLPSSLLLALTFIPVTNPAHTFDLVQGYLYGYGDPTSHNPSTGRNVISLLLSLCGCASDTPSIMSSSPESSPVSSSTTTSVSNNPEDDEEDDCSEEEGSKNDKKKQSLSSSSALSMAQLQHSSSSQSSTTTATTTTTATPKKQKLIFNSEAYALKLNAYEFATGVLSVICGMNNVNRYTAVIPPATTTLPLTLPSPFEVFHSKPLNQILPQSIPFTQPGNKALAVSSSSFGPSQGKTLMPSLSVIWPNPYKFHYYYSPDSFIDLLGASLAMFVVSRKTIEDIFCLRILKVLAANGEDLTRTNVLGQNLLMLAIAYQRSEEVIKFLLKPHTTTLHQGNSAIPKEDILFSFSSGNNDDNTQENYFDGIVPIIQKDVKMINLNQVDIFGRNLYHYRLNPGLQYDSTLFTNTESEGKAGNITATTQHRCDVMNVVKKNQRLIDELSRNDDFTMYFPDFDPKTNPKSSTAQHQGVRWYDLCDGLMKGMSGVYDGEENDTRQREFGYIVETFSASALTTMIESVRGKGHDFKLQIV